MTPPLPSGGAERILDRLTQSGRLPRAAPQLQRRLRRFVALWLVAFGLALIVAVAVRPVPRSAPKPGAQILWNGGFEDGVAYWEAYGSGTLAITSQARSGHRAALVSSGASANQYGLTYASVVWGPLPGERYSLSAWVKPLPTAVGHYASVQLNEVGASTQPMGAQSVRLGPGWQCIGVSGRVTDSTATWIDAFVLFQASVGVGDAAEVDDVSLSRDGRPCSRGS